MFKIDPFKVHHHKLPIPRALKVLGILLVLTVLTVAVATPVTGVSFGMFNAVIAFGIASAKAAFVLLYFMGLKDDDKLFITLFLSGIFFLILLWAISIFDITTRAGVESALQ